MEATKKLNTKYNVAKKITIKYYLHEIKNNSVNEIKRYSLNILLTVNRKVTKFKSKIAYDGYRQLDDNVFNHLYIDAIEREKGLIYDIIKDLKPFDSDNFDIKNVYKIYDNERWFLGQAINDLLFFELFDTNDSLRIPFMRFVNPLSFLNITNDKVIIERAKKFKSKIWSIDMIVWGLAFNNIEGFKVYSPTVYDLKTSRFQDAINSTDFQMITSIEKQELINEVKNLINKYRQNLYN